MQEHDESLFADGLFTVKEAVEFSKLCRTKLYGLMDAGRIIYAKIDGSRRIPKRALIKFLAGNAIGGWAA
jgi:hypothetical protein